ncbi:transglutaminase family protein [Amycolatopsis sp.]|jgi:transglutaminase-like putative cysteine protease|uniref:transglutaminase-like domain-containing protein n=1 Tax=Amycolatopsis sp. TaxID=37632 RepID=UPI002E053B02|nr:transglutaminase family protein [Amycolatopsis sp.]
MTRALIDVEMSFRVTKPGRAALSVAVAEGGTVDRSALEFLGQPVPYTTADFDHGTLVHVLDLPLGDVKLHYTAERTLRIVEPAAITDAELVLYTRPSRYCPSDRMGGIAMARFGTLPTVREQVDAIVRYVNEQLAYVVGVGGPNDDAIDSMLAGQGVCRDFAHLCVALCRVIDIPARFVAVYAPGLSPMDFHAVFEAAIDGHWYVFDATHLAPRKSMTRIATGRDAADTAFLSTLGSEIEFESSTVLTTVEPDLPDENWSELVTLA